MNHKQATTAGDPPISGIDAREAASLGTRQVMARLDCGEQGLDEAEAARRLAAAGPNAVRVHHVQPLRILGHQLRSAVLILLAVTAVVSFFLGQRTDTIVIGTILLASIGMGFVNEYRAERATQALHSQLRYTAATLRGGKFADVDVIALVPGDIVRLTLGEVVPADIRLLETAGLECNESVLTGESMPVYKSTPAVGAGSAVGDLACCALMGTVVRAGAGTGVVVATGGRAEFGRIALGLGERQAETNFQVGLSRFSVLLLQVAIALTSLILVTNLLLHRPLIQSLLFSLTIAVGITPQLLPAVVSTSLATGSRQLAKLKVLVKRLVCIEDLGDMDVLVTDKTGTLTEGRLTFVAALDPSGSDAPDVVVLGLLSTETEPGVGSEVAGGNPLDAALWEAARGTAEHSVEGYVRLGLCPFDH